jgi:hypothetical protein
MLVTYLDAEPNGLAAMLGGLIEANLTAHPDRLALLAEPATYSITATDVDVSVTIHLGSGSVKVANGVRGTPHVMLRSDSESLLKMSAVPLRYGIPDPATGAGREVLSKVVRGRLRVKGMLTQRARLARLNELLSVASGPGGGSRT